MDCGDVEWVGGELSLGVSSHSRQNFGRTPKVLRAVPTTPDAIDASGFLLAHKCDALMRK